MYECTNWQQTQHSALCLFNFISARNLLPVLFDMYLARQICIPFNIIFIVRFTMHKLHAIYARILHIWRAKHKEWVKENWTQTAAAWRLVSGIRAHAKQGRIATNLRPQNGHRAAGPPEHRRRCSKTCYAHMPHNARQKFSSRIHQWPVHWTLDNDMPTMNGRLDDGWIATVIVGCIHSSMHLLCVLVNFQHCAHENRCERGMDILSIANGYGLLVSPPWPNASML